MYGLLRNIQNIDRREQYHEDQHEVLETARENNRMDASSASDMDHHNHKVHRHRVSDIDTEQEYDLEDNYKHRARQRKRKQCVDHDQYSLQ